MQNIRSLGDFIEQEIGRRGMSAREFAEFVGVSHNTISRQIDPLVEKRPTPTMEFVLKIADATQTDLSALLALAYPDLVNPNTLSADARIFAQRYERAPEHIKEAIRALIMVASARAK